MHALVASLQVPGVCVFPWSTPREAKKQSLSGSAAASTQKT